MNKNDLVDRVAERVGLSKVMSSKAVEALLETITGSLKTGTTVRLVGFGTFTVSRRKASEGRNPRTGEKIQIPASKVPKFRAGQALRSAVN